MSRKSKKRNREKRDSQVYERYTGTYASSKWACSGHNQPKLVIDTDSLKVWAGSKSATKIPPIGAIIVDLAGAYLPPVFTSGGLKLEGFDWPRVVIDWPDMTTPRLTQDMWRQLISQLANQERDLFVACSMGHGRTGTALIIFAHMLGQLPKDECPVKWIRRVYCEEAVETTTQIDYLEDILGYKLPEARGSLASVVTYPNYRDEVWDATKKAWVKKDDGYPLSTCRWDAQQQKYVYDTPEIRPLSSGVAQVLVDTSDGPKQCPKYPEQCLCGGEYHKADEATASLADEIYCYCKCGPCQAGQHCVGEFCFQDEADETSVAVDTGEEIMLMTSACGDDKHEECQAGQTWCQCECHFESEVSDNATVGT